VFVVGGVEHRGGKVSRYFSAMGSARETIACLQVAAAMQYVEDVDDQVHKLTR
jgi:hypothetical protein